MQLLEAARLPVERLAEAIESMTNLIKTECPQRDWLSVTGIDEGEYRAIQAKYSVTFDPVKQRFHAPGPPRKKAEEPTDTEAVICHTG